MCCISHGVTWKSSISYCKYSCHINRLTRWLEIKRCLFMKTYLFINALIKMSLNIACSNWLQRIGLLPIYMQILFISGSLNWACHTWFTAIDYSTWQLGIKTFINKDVFLFCYLVHLINIAHCTLVHATVLAGPRPIYVS